MTSQPATYNDVVRLMDRQTKRLEKRLDSMYRDELDELDAIADAMTDEELEEELTSMDQKKVLELLKKYRVDQA